MLGSGYSYTPMQEGEAQEEPFECQLGHRVTKTAKKLLGRLVFELGELDREASFSSVLDLLIKRAALKEIEGEFPPKK
jgi:hypothetical protein